MRESSSSRVSLFAQVTLAGAYGEKLPTYLALPIKMISLLQITHIILKTSFPSCDDSKYIIFGFIRTVVAVISSLDTYEGMQWGETVTFMIWLGIWFYLVGYLVFVARIIWQCNQRERVSKKASKVFTRLNVLHSKLIFFMIHCFGFQLLDSLRQCPQQDDLAFYCGTPMTIVTVAQLVVNLGIASVIELAVYQTYKDKNVFAVKDNTHAMIQLAHKAVLPPLLTLASSIMAANSVLNLVFAVANHVIIFMRLPYYNRLPLKIAGIFSSIHLTSTLILVFRPTIDGYETCFELLVILVTAGMIRIKLAILDKIFEEILKLNFRSTYDILHLSILLKEYVLKPTLIRVNCNYDYRTLFTYNLMQSHRWEVNDLGDQMKCEDLKVKVNRLAADELLKCYKRNPSSKELLLFMIQFYIEKMKNITKAYVLMERLQELPLFTANLNNITHITDQLQVMMFNSYIEHDKSLELLSYFKNREVSTRVKLDIETEAQLHAEFWGLLLKPDVDVHDALQICNKIDMLAENIEKNWKENEDDFVKNFPIPLMIYGIYLNILRGLPHLGCGILERFTSGKNSRLLKSIEKWFSQEKAMIIASNQKESLGEIIDATHSVKNIFNIDKDDLIGRKVNMLMPSMVQAKHNMMIERYNNRPEISLNFNSNVYCKTADKRFFLAELSLRVYPYIDKGTGLIATIKRKEEVTPMFFVNAQGEIVDCSRDLIESFKINFLVSKGTKLKDLAPEFEVIDHSFNKVYGHLAVGANQPVASLTEDLHFDEVTPKRVRSANTEGHLMLSKGDQDHVTSSRGLLSSPRALSRDDTHDQIPSEKDEEGHVYIRAFHMSEKFDEKIHSTVPDPSTRFGLTPKKEKGFSTSRKPKVDMEFAQGKEGDEKALDEGQMKEICRKFGNGSVLALQIEKGENNDNPVLYSIKVEPFVVEGELFKAVKVQKAEKRVGDSTSKKEITKSNTGTGTGTGNNNKVSNLDVVKKDLERPFIKMETVNQKSQESLEPESSENSTNKKMSMHVNYAEEGPYHYVGKRNSISSSSSKRDSQAARSLRVEKALYHAFKKDKISRLVRGYLWCFYFAMVLIIALTLVDYFKTKSSFDEVEFATQVVNIGSERLYNLGNIWAVAMYIYSTGTLNSQDSQSITSSIANINALTASLLELLDKIGLERISQAFFDKTVIFEVPYEKSILSTTPIDEITSLNLVLQKMKEFTKTNISDVNLEGSTYLFSLNNTVNDLFLSVEDDLRITRLVKQEVYDKNNQILQIFMAIQFTASCIIYFSLIPIFLSIISDYKKLFKTLRLVQSKGVISRERDIKLFQHGIHESVESEKLIENLNKMISGAASSSAAEIPKVGFKVQRTKKLQLKTVHKRMILLLVVALLLFGAILGVTMAASIQSLQSIKDFQTIDQAAMVAQNMMYKSIFMAGNALYYMAFYNATTMKFRNVSPIVQFEEYLGILEGVNNDLLEAINIKAGLYNSSLEIFISGDMCSYLEDGEMVTLCSSVTKGGKTGLFGLNELYAQTLSEYVSSFQKDPTQDNYKVLLKKFFKHATPMRRVMGPSYMYLKDDLLETFLTQIQDQKNTLTIYCIGMCFSCAIVTLALRLITLRALIVFDQMRFKVFRIIPSNFTLENRAIAFYFKRNYPKEVSEISSLL